MYTEPRTATDRRSPCQSDLQDNSEEWLVYRMTRYRTGFVGVFGQTNVGKSTFLNEVLGRKLLMTSAKPQATRNRIQCVHTTDEGQIVFVDTPGLHQPKNKLGRHLLREAHRGARGMNVMAYVIEPWGAVHPVDRDALDHWADHEAVKVLLVNKIDTARGNALEETLLAYAALDQFADLIPISAARGIGLDDAVRTIISHLPEGDPLFPSDVACEHAEEFLVAELVRDHVFRHTRQEVPYASAVNVKWIREGENGVTEIRAEIVVARESQRGILIGKAGNVIKAIGSGARADIEQLLGTRVYLQLTVRSEPRWTEKDDDIERLTNIE